MSNIAKKKPNANQTHPVQNAPVYSFRIPNGQSDKQGSKNN